MFIVMLLVPSKKFEQSDDEMLDEIAQIRKQLLFCK